MNSTNSKYGQLAPYEGNRIFHNQSAFSIEKILYFNLMIGIRLGSYDNF